MIQYLWLLPLGFLVGAFGTFIGAGGGFILIPVLLIAYPQAATETLTSISLAVIFFNASSGSWAYAKMKRIDYRSGFLFAAASIPGAVLGALTTDYIPRRIFNAAFGILMIITAVFLMFHTEDEHVTIHKREKGLTTRHVIETDGAIHTFSYNPSIGVILSFFVGYLSSLLGIGGGIVHVPALVGLLNFPVHIATATSHFMLAIMALTGTLVHIVTGSFSHGGVRRTIMLGIGVLIGAQVGACLAKYVHGVWIIRVLAIALASVGIRILLMA
jgi:uncharacterized membrane protein YfcA